MTMETTQYISLINSMVIHLETIAGHLRQHDIPDSSAINATKELLHTKHLLEMVTQLERFVAKHGEMK